MIPISPQIPTNKNYNIMEAQNKRFRYHETGKQYAELEWVKYWFATESEMMIVAAR